MDRVHFLDPDPTPCQIVAEAWRLELCRALQQKVTPDPALVPCLECGAEADWLAGHCPACGVEFCGDTRSYRARIYEGLLFG